MTPKRSTILVIDDDPGQVALVTAALERRREYRTVSSTSPIEGIELARAEAPDLLICDISMPQMDGIEVTRTLRAEFPTMPIIVVTGFEDADTAERAYAAGATDFAVKPIEGIQLIVRVEHALREIPTREILREVTDNRLQALVLGEHPRVMELRSFVSSVAGLPGVAALLLGESGTGKNLVARAIHSASAGAEARFVEVNCAALPANLLEAELFGYEKGAFTDARQAKQGLVEAAAGGTLFLDEIGTLAVELQAKLLTFLESHTFRRVGSTQDRHADLRIVAATNADLPRQVAEGRFREDLFYRLNVAHFTLPPLREIRSDIPTLARHFVEKAAAYFRKPVPTLDAAGIARLQGYDWPGNVRELRNVIERALIFSQGAVLTIDSPTGTIGSVTGSASATAPTTEALGGFQIPLGLTLEEMERRYIEATLAAADGQVEKAAKSLGVTRKVFWAKRRKLGILE